jgi:uncharacterized ParB-like nuclease family protein
MINLGNIIKILRPSKRDSEAKCFCKVQDCDGTFNLIDRGVCSVPLKQIVGSVGKCLDFDSQFTPKSHVPLDRVISIKRAMLEGKSLPPVILYKINDEYYVMDGNHRIAAAKELDRFNITAKIVEFIPINHTCSISKESV